MKRRVNNQNLAVLIAAVLLILSACSPSRISVEEYNKAQGVSPTSVPEEVQETEEVFDEPDSGSEVGEPLPVAQVIGDTPEDVPIMDAGYDVLAGASGRNVVYLVNATIDETVAFYQAELPKHGWEMAGPPDNAIKSIGTMLRENAVGDRLAINLQRNELDGVVRLTITISRAD